MVCVLGILDDLCCQEEVHECGWVAILTPAIDRVLEVGPKQCSLKLIHIPASSAKHARLLFASLCASCDSVATMSLLTC